jgi:hypothetical protein
MASRPSLNEAKMRVLAATHRLTDLADVALAIDRHVVANAPRISLPYSSYEAGVTTGLTTDWAGTFPHQLTTEARVRASEAIHHLRTSLEYLAYSVVWHDSGSVHEKSEFPMVHKPRDWPDKLRRVLPGISDENATRIKKAQPFKHCRWTMQLQELSNTDKHRHVLDFQQSAESMFNISVGRRDPDDESIWLIDSTAPKGRLLLASGGRVLPELVALTIEVAEYVNSFGPSFNDPQPVKVQDWPWVGYESIA